MELICGLITLISSFNLYAVPPVINITAPSGITEVAMGSEFAGLQGGADFPFRFAGGVGAMTDPEGGIYMRARHYHGGIEEKPIIIRFYRPSQRDTLSGGSGLSLLIPGNHAENYYDTTGRRIELVIQP